MAYKRLGLSRRLIRFICLVIALFTGYAFLPWFDVKFHVPSTPPPSLRTYQPLPRQETAAGSWKNIRVAIVEYAPYHEEVWGAIVHSFRHLRANITLFRPAYRFSFGNIFDTQDVGPILDPATLPTYLENAEFDVVVIASGDKYWVGEDTRKALAASKNTLVVLVIHHSQALGIERSTFQDVAAEGRLSLLGLAGHTTDMISTTIANWSVEDHEVGWDRTLVQTFVPVFPITITTKPKQSDTPRNSLSVSRVAIQGRIEYTRRDYSRIFSELYQAILDNPALWGYDSSSDDDQTFQARTWSPVPPFTLHLIGEHVGGVTWPAKLDNVIHVHSGLEYEQYYNLLSTMDLVMPAFAGPEYMVERASSSMTAAIMAKVPILVTPQHLRAYTFLDHPAVVVHPAGMSAIHAIRLLRSERDPWTPDLMPVKIGGGHFANNRRTAKSELEPSSLWADYHERLYGSNNMVWNDIADRIKWMRWP